LAFPGLENFGNLMKIMNYTHIHESKLRLN